MGITVTPFAAHVAVPSLARSAAAPTAVTLGVWPTALRAPWPLPDTGLGANGQPGRLFTEGTVAVVRGVTAADVAAGLRYLADRIEQGAGAVVRVDAGFAAEAERVVPALVAGGARGN